MDRIKTRRPKAGQGGFTLIELLVVIAILGILSGVVVFAVSGINDKGERSACRIDTRTLATAQEAYLASPTGGNGNYGTETQLKNGGFLSEESTLHNITNLVVATPTVLPSYDITVASTGPCGTAGGVVGTSDNI